MTEQDVKTSYGGEYNVDGAYADDDHSDRLGHFAEKAGDYASWMDGKLRHIVSEHPIAVLSGMVAVGFLFGRLVSRRS